MLGVCPLAYRTALAGKPQFRLGADERANRNRRLEVRLARRRDVSKVLMHHPDIQDGGGVVDRSENEAVAMRTDCEPKCRAGSLS